MKSLFIVFLVLVVFDQDFLFANELKNNIKPVRIRTLDNPNNLPVIKIGRTLTQTSGSSQVLWNLPYDYALQTWIYWVNTVKGGIILNNTKYLIEDYLYNDGADCETAKIIYEEQLILKDKVDILFSPLLPADSCLDIVFIAENYSKPYLNVGDWSLQYAITNLPQYKNLNWAVNLLPDYSTAASACIDPLAKSGAKTYVLAYVDYIAGFAQASIYSAFLDGMEMLDNYTILDGNQFASEGCSYINPLIDKWKKLNPDVFIGTVYKQNSAQFLVCLHLKKFAPKGIFLWSGPAGFFDVRLEAENDGVGSLAESLYDRSFNFTDPVFDYGDNYATTFEKIAGYPVGYEATFTNAAIMAQDCIVKKNSFDPYILIDCIKNYNGSTLYGPISIVNNQINRTYLCVQQIDKINISVIYPEGFPNYAPIIYPSNFKYTAKFLYDLDAGIRKRNLILEIMLGGVLPFLILVTIGLIALAHKFYKEVDIICLRYNPDNGEGWLDFTLEKGKHCLSCVDS